VSEQNEMQDDEPEVDPSSTDYTTAELKRNRRNILLWTAGFVAFFWFAARDAAVILTAITVGVSLICLKLFASQSASKLGDDFAGSGKRVQPRTMGTILGYLYRGFRND
jgi:hypothetical protein